MKTLLVTVFFSVLVLFLPQGNQQYNWGEDRAIKGSGQKSLERVGPLGIETEISDLFTGDAGSLTCPGKTQGGRFSKKCTPANWIIPGTLPEYHGTNLPAGGPLLCVLAPANKLQVKDISQQGGPLHDTTLPGEEMPDFYEIDDVRIVSGLIRIDLSN